MNAGFGATEIWPAVALGEVAELCLGKMLDAQKNKGRPQPYLRNPNVRWLDFDFSDVQTMRFEEHEEERYGLLNGDVLICEGGEAGRAAIWDGRVAGMKFQKAIHRVRCGPRLHNRFLVHQLMADYSSGRLTEYYTGATIKHLTGQDLARYRFILPPLVEQRRIAEILDKADALRAKRRAALAQLDSLAQSIFLDMFGDPIANEKGWKAYALEDITRKITDGTHKTPAYTDSGVEFLSAKDLKNGGIKWGSGKFISESEHRKLVKRCDPQRGDILLAKSGSLGSVAIVDRAQQFSLFESLCLIKVTRELCEAEFLVGTLRTPSMLAHLLGRNKGVAIKHLHLVDVRSLMVPLPPLPMQLNFANRVRALEELKGVLWASLEVLDGLFASLQSRAFRGVLAS